MKKLFEREVAAELGDMKLQGWQDGMVCWLQLVSEEMQMSLMLSIGEWHDLIDAVKAGIKTITEDTLLPVGNA